MCKSSVGRRLSVTQRKLYLVEGEHFVLVFQEGYITGQLKEVGLMLQDSGY